MKHLEELWAERPPFRKSSRPAREVDNPNHIVVGGVEEVRQRARVQPPGERLQRLYEAAKRASVEAPSERERRDALWVLNFVVSARGKTASPKRERVLREKESQYAPWMS